MNIGKLVSYSGFALMVSSCQKTVAPSPIGHYLYEGKGHQMHVSLDSFGRGSMRYKSEFRDTAIGIRWIVENSRISLMPCLVSESIIPYDECGYGFEYSIDNSSAYIIMGGESMEKLKNGIEK